MRLRGAYGKLAFYFVLMLSAAAPGAQQHQLQAVTVDFSITLQEIHRILEDEGPAGLPTDRALVIDGVVAEIVVIDPEPESFLVQIELVTGRWIGLEEIRIYRAYVFVQGPRFVERVSLRAAANDQYDVVTPNSRVIVLGNIVDVFVDEDGTSAPIIDGIDLRLIR